MKEKKKGRVKGLIGSVVIGFVGFYIGQKMGEKYGKETERDKNNSVMERAEKKPVFGVTKNGVDLVMMRADYYKPGLKQPIGFK